MFFVHVSPPKNDAKPCGSHRYLVSSEVSQLGIRWQLVQSIYRWQGAGHGESCGDGFAGSLGSRGREVAREISDYLDTPIRMNRCIINDHGKNAYKYQFGGINFQICSRGSGETS